MWGGWSTPHPGRFTPGKDPVPIVQEAGWAPWQVWTDAENLASTGIRSPDRPARSKSLYRLSYPGPRPRSFQTTYGSRIKWFPWVLTPGVKRNPCDADHLHLRPSVSEA